MTFWQLFQARMKSDHNFRQKFVLGKVYSVSSQTSVVISHRPVFRLDAPGKKRVVRTHGTKKRGTGWTRQLHEEPKYARKMRQTSQRINRR